MSEVIPYFFPLCAKRSVAGVKGVLDHIRNRSGVRSFVGVYTGGGTFKTRYFFVLSSRLRIENTSGHLRSFPKFMEF